MDGTGMVMLRPARIRERAGLPCIDPLWNRAVIFGLESIVTKDEEVKYPKDIAQGSVPRRGCRQALKGHI